MNQPTFGKNYNHDSSSSKDNSLLSENIFVFFEGSPEALQHRI